MRSFNEPEWDETVIYRHLHAFEILFLDHLRTEEKLLEHREYPFFEDHVRSHEEYESEVIWLIHGDKLLERIIRRCCYH